MRRSSASRKLGERPVTAGLLAASAVRAHGVPADGAMAAVTAVLVAMAVLPVMAPAFAGTELAPVVGPSGEQPPAPWTYAGLPGQKPPATRFAIGEVEGRRALRVEAQRSYGNLVHSLAGTTPSVLSWRWRVDVPLASVDLRSKEGDDTALKVCAMFDMPRDNVPFVERQLLKLAEARLGETLPTATLCYVWDPSLPAGSVVPNAYSRRLRFLTLGGAVRTWTSERRDLAADFLAVFGDEARSVPPLRAIAVGADADNTAGRSIGWIDELQHRPATSP